MTLRQDLPGRPARERHTGEHSHAGNPAVIAIDRDGHLARRGDGQDSRVLDPERPRLGRAHARREDLAALAVPAGGVNDRLPVGSEPGAGQVAPAERQGRAFRRRGLAVAPRLHALTGEERDNPEARHGEHRSGQAGAREPQAPLLRRSDPGARDPRGLVPQQRQIPRQVLGRAVSVLGVLRHAALDDPGRPVGTRGADADSGSGSVSMMAESVCAEDGRSNARLPEAIS